MSTAAEPRVKRDHPLGRALRAVLSISALVAVASYGLPDEYKSTGVALAFLGMTYWLVLRRDDTDLIRSYGLSLGGLLEPEPLELRRLGRDGAHALGWALGLALLCFPLFWLGYVWWWKPGPFVPAPIGTIGEELIGQLLVVALPEEAFYRGYLQTVLDEAWAPRWRIAGAPLGWGMIVASAVFALGHLLTEPNPTRLAVFFPSLLFGWLRSKTGGIGAPLAFHASCNLFSLYLEKSYGLGS